MRSKAYIDIDDFRRIHISVAFGCVYVSQVVRTPENVAFWMRSNAASLLAIKRLRTRFESKNIYMGREREMLPAIERLSLLHSSRQVALVPSNQ